MLSLALALLTQTATPNLTEGVQRLPLTGTPGTVACVGPGSFPVVTARVDGGRLPLLAASNAGGARVAIFGHGGYLGLPDGGDTRPLVRNLLQWMASGRPQARLVCIRQDAVAGLAQSLALPVEKRNQLGTLDPRRDVLVLDAHAVSEADVPALKTYLKAGGAWLTASTGWGWAQINRKSVIHMPAQAALAEVGLAAGPSTIDADQGGMVVLQTPLPLHAAYQAWENLDGDQAGPASVVLLDGLRSVGPDHALVKELRRRDQTAPALRIGPDAKLPARQGLNRVRAYLHNESWRGLPADQVQAHPSASLYPGQASGSAPTSATRTLQGQAGWNSTGLYANAGVPITVQFSSDTAAQGWRIRIGSHSDQVWHHNPWSRFPQIDAEWPVNGERTTVASAFGGLIYLVRDQAPSSAVRVTIRGAHEAPHFKRGVTTANEWKQNRAAPGPWAEIEGDRMIITVPSSSVRNLEKPEAVAKLWDEVADHCADLAGWPHARARKERFVADTQISAGYMHAGYPIMTHLDVADRVVDAAALMKEGSWGHYHEIGHNHQDGMWTFEGTGEVTVNLFTLYIYDHLNKGRQADRAFDDASNLKRWKEFKANNPSHDKWKGDAFLALVMYAQMQNAFGWEPYKKVFREYDALPQNERPRSQQDRRDQWMIRMSRAVGRNLGPFFEAWHMPITPEAKAQVANLPRWMPNGMD